MKKLLAIFLAVLSCAGLFAGCATSDAPAEVVLPVQNVEETYENRYLALEETAMAYWRKGVNVQYDDQACCILGRTSGLRTSQDTFNTPEYASADHTVYNVCATYVYHCLYHTFGYKMRGDTAGATQMALLGKGDMQENEMVYFYELIPGEEEANLAAMHKAWETLQPGDVLSYERTKTSYGHTVIWFRDFDGDGKNDLLNVDGTHYNASTGEDPRENWDGHGGVHINGSHRSKLLNSAEDYFFNPKSSQYLGHSDTGKYYCIIRLPDTKHAEKYPITERAKTRLLYPGLDIYYNADTRFYGAVTKGEEVTYTLKLKNNSEQNHEGLLIQIPVPENSKLVRINGESAKGTLIKFTVNIPAGEEITCTYTVQATGEVGSRIFTKGGYVHAIPLPEIYTGIRSGAVDGTAVFNAAEKHKDKTGMAFANAVYAEMGMELGLSEKLRDLQDGLYDEKRIGEAKVFLPMETPANETLAKMAVQDFFGGKFVLTPMDSRRINQLRTYDMVAGDILIWEEFKGDCQVAIFDGQTLLYPTGNGTLKAMEQVDLDRFLIYRFFICLRPTQAM